MSQHTATIEIWDGVPMTCEYEFYPEATPILNDIYGGDPGWPAYSSLISCMVGGIDIYEMLSPKQIDRIEAALTAQMEETT